MPENMAGNTVNLPVNTIWEIHITEKWLAMIVHLKRLVSSKKKIHSVFSENSISNIT